MNPIVIQNEALQLEFNPQSGALTRMIALETGWEPMSRPELGLSFRLLVPLPNQRNNGVFGEEQTLTSHTASANSLTLVWDGVQSQHGGKLDIKVVLEITLEARKALYRMTVANQSHYTVENVYCPYLGD